MADITTLFKATLKTLKAREKSYNNNPDKQIDKSIFKKHKKSEFSIASKNVVGLITKLKEFLLDHRKEYLNDGAYLGLSQSSMTDLERDQIDSETEVFMKKCKDAIVQLGVQAGRQKASRQARENKTCILELLDRYLIGVCKLYSQQRAIRMKRHIDRRQISKLQFGPLFCLSKSVDNLAEEGGDTGTTETYNVTNRSSKNNTKKDDKLNLKDNRFQDNIPLNKQQQKQQLAQQQQQQQQHQERQPELSEEERLMLTVENDQLFQSMSTMADEVRVIEGKVVEIAQLQELFTEKILEQETDVDRLAGEVVGSSENMREANDEIREAMKNNAGFRVWILFFLLVCTFSLLFLDWYNA